jgi:hypothetical protein
MIGQRWQDPLTWSSVIPIKTPARQKRTAVFQHPCSQGRKPSNVGELRQGYLSHATTPSDVSRMTGLENDASLVVSALARRRLCAPNRLRQVGWPDPGAVQDNGAARNAVYPHHVGVLSCSGGQSIAARQVGRAVCPAGRSRDGRGAPSDSRRLPNRVAYVEGAGRPRPRIRSLALGCLVLTASYSIGVKETSGLTVTEHANVALTSSRR